MSCGHEPENLESLFVHRCGELPVNTQGVHALIIGTSAYRPAEPLPPSPTARERKRHEMASNENIEGAALGAANFARFLRDLYRDPAAAPLKTVRLLLGPTAHETQTLRADGFSWQDASIGNVDRALKGWVDDCDHGQVGIAYFAGHGIITPDGASWVLLGECNNTRDDPFEAAINVLCVRQALEQTSAYFTVFVSDCCAVYENRIKRTPAAPAAGTAGIGPTLYSGISFPGKYELTISAAREGGRAYVIEGEGTVLSQSLLPLLEKAGSVVRATGSNDWFFAITREPLEEGLLTAMEIEHVDQQPRVKGYHPPSGIHRPTPPPTFDLALVNRELDPVKCHVFVTGGGHVRSETILPGQQISLRLAAGSYTVSVDSADVPVPPKTVDLIGPLTIELP